MDRENMRNVDNKDPGISGPSAESTKNDVIFDMSKRCSHTPKNGYKKLYRKLRATYSMGVNKDEIAADVICNAKCLVFGNPRQEFSPAELDVLKQYVEEGGSMLFLFRETDGKKEHETNANLLLEQFGLGVNNDALVRTVYYRYHHPKETLVVDGVMNSSMTKAALARSERQSKSKSSTIGSDGTDRKKKDKLEFVFPYGSTLAIQKPAVPLLSSGHIAYPLNRPIAGVWQGESMGGSKAGRVAVVGSADMLGDDWLDKEDNWRIGEQLIGWLTRGGGQGDAEGGYADLSKLPPEDGAEVSEYHRLPDTEQLSERLHSCLQVDDSLPGDGKDFNRVFDETLFGFSTKLIPATVALYDTLNVKHEPLTLIPPQFELPLPPLVPAVFPPAIREPPPPALDQFDLDEHFASEKVRLAQLTNKCGNDDLEYYIKEAGEILSVSQQLPQDQRTAKHVLFHIFEKLVNFKKLNQEAGVSGPGDGNPGDFRPSTRDGVEAAVSSSMPDYRPDTASAIRAVEQQGNYGGDSYRAEAKGDGRGYAPQGSPDARPDTASALRAVQEAEAQQRFAQQGSTEMARPDTAAALRAVAEMESKGGPEAKGYRK